MTNEFELQPDVFAENPEFRIPNDEIDQISIEPLLRLLTPDHREQKVTHLREHLQMLIIIYNHMKITNNRIWNKSLNRKH